MMALSVRFRGGSGAGRFGEVAGSEAAWSTRG
jgi:hypothetical protein